MSGWAIAGIAVLAFVAWTVLVNRRLRLKQGRLASSRAPHDETSFIEAMVLGGVGAATARFLWVELSDYYFKPLKPSPDDRLCSTLDIDPDDICDLVEKFSKVMRGGSPDLDAPVEIPNDQSIAEFGAFLDQQVGISMEADQ